MEKHRRVLVLNKSWIPVRIITLERSISLLFSEYKNGDPKARIIDPNNDFQVFTWEDWSKIAPADGEDCINSVNSVFRVPKVILLTRYDKLPLAQGEFNRRTIHKMYENTCQYCGEKFPKELLSIEHIVPKSRGGSTSWTNCTLACVECNSKKSNRTPEEANMKLLSKPYKPPISLFRSDFKVKEWHHFIPNMYFPGKSN